MHSGAACRADYGSQVVGVLDGVKRNQKWWPVAFLKQFEEFFEINDLGCRYAGHDPLVVYFAAPVFNLKGGRKLNFNVLPAGQIDNFLDAGIGF